MAILRELALDGGGDLRIADGRLVLIDGAEAVAQRIAVRLRTLLGEWRFDTTLGTPWLQQLLGRRSGSTLLRSVLRERILGTDGVARILSLDVRVDPRARTASVRGRVQLETDDVTDVVVEAPF